MKISWGNFSDLKDGEIEIKDDLVILKNILGKAEIVSENLRVKKEKSYKLVFKIRSAGSIVKEIKQAKTEDEKFLYEFLKETPLFWTRGVDFIGIILSFYDRKGKLLSEKEFPIETPSTMPYFEIIKHKEDYSHGWVNTWIEFKTDKNTEFMKVVIKMVSERFKIEGGIAFKEFILKEEDELKVKDYEGLLKIDVVDEKGENTPCQISVVNLDNYREYFPEFSVKYIYPKPFFFSFNGSEILKLPEGWYKVEAIKGFDKDISRAILFLPKGERINLTLKIKNSFNMKERNWYSADHHVHLFGHFNTAYPMLNLASLKKISDSIGLDYTGYGSFFHKCKKGNNVQFTSDHGLVELTSEIPSHIWGHFCIVGIKNESIKFPNCFQVYPPIIEFLKEVTETGGAIIAAHPSQIIQIPYNIVYEEDDLSKLTGDKDRWNLCKFLPVLLLYNIPAGYDLLIADGCGTYRMFLNQYYKFLNFGFKLAACGSTDSNVDMANSKNPVGSCRTYVYAKELSIENISEGYRKGNTFATNGPLIIFKVNGKIPGETVFINKGEEIDLEGEIFSSFGLSFLEIVLNEKVIYRKELTGHKKAEFSLKTKVEEMGWIALRVRGPGNRWVNSYFISPEERKYLGQFAHTTPVYIRFKGERLKPKKEIVDYFYTWIENMKRLPDAWKEYLKRDIEKRGISLGKAKKEILEILNKAQERIESIYLKGWEEI